MNGRPDRFVRLSAVMFGLLALFNIAVGTFHTILFASQGSQALFSKAYGIPVSAADMKDPARLLGSDAIEVYSVLLAGYGLMSLWATVASLRGQRSGFWLNTVIVGIAQLAVLYGLVIPGRLTGANAYAGLVLYVMGVLFGGISLVRDRRQKATPSLDSPRLAASR